MSKTQDYKLYPVRSSAILTGSYVAGTVIEEVHNKNQMILLVDFTKGSLTDMDLKVEFSPDGTNYYQEVSEAVSSGEATVSLKHHTFTATGKYRIPIAIKDRYIKISVIGNGTTTSSLVTVDAIIGVS